MSLSASVSFCAPSLPFPSRLLLWPTGITENRRQHFSPFEAGKTFCKTKAASPRKYKLRPRSSVAPTPNVKCSLGFQQGGGSSFASRRADDKASRVRGAEPSRRAVSAPCFCQERGGEFLWCPAGQYIWTGIKQPRNLGQRCVLEYNQTRKKKEEGRRNKSKKRTVRKNSSALRSGVEGVVGGKAVGGPPPPGRRHCCANHGRDALLCSETPPPSLHAEPRLLCCSCFSDLALMHQSEGGKTSVKRSPTPNACAPSDARCISYLALHANLGFPSLGGLESKTCLLGSGDGVELKALRL